MDSLKMYLDPIHASAVEIKIDIILSNLLKPWI